MLPEVREARTARDRDLAAPWAGADAGGSRCVAGRRKPGQSRGQRGEGGRELPRGQDAEGGRHVEGSAVVGRLKQKVFGGQGNDRVEKESRAVWQQRGQPRCGVLGWESEWGQDASSGLVTGRKEGGVSRHGCRREAGLPGAREGRCHGRVCRDLVTLPAPVPTRQSPEGRDPDLLT